MTATASFGDRLADSPVYRKFRDHPFFAAVDMAEPWAARLGERSLSALQLSAAGGRL